MNDKEKEILQSRLKEIFDGTPQDVIANSLCTSQSNVSKWVRGIQIPTTETLFTISRKFNISIDWLLGLSNVKEVDEFNIEDLTYEQIAKIFAYLFDNRTIQIPNIANIPELNQIVSSQQEESEETDNEIEKIEIRNSDYIQIKDMIISDIMRRRFKVSEFGSEYLETWAKNLNIYKKLRLLSYNDYVNEYIMQKKSATFKDGDWAELIKEILKLGEAEIKKIVSGNTYEE